eukprot:364915-Chlamydomonas_euryale.AAC.32
MWRCRRQRALLPAGAAHSCALAARVSWCSSLTCSGRACVTVQLSIMVAANGESIASMSSALGRPVNSMIRSS